MRPDRRGTVMRSRGVFKLVFFLESAYRFEVSVFGMILVSRIFLFTLLWRALYQPGQVSGGMTLQQAIGYSVLAAILEGHRDVAHLVDSFPDRIREGTVAYLFVRPISPLANFWMLNVGAIAYRLGWIVVGGSIATALGLLPVPANLAVLGLSIVSLLVAECVIIYLDLFIQLVGFWTIESWGILPVYWFIVQILSGSLVPLWFFPGWARTTLLALPFAAAASTPVSLYVGRIASSQALLAIALQLFWLAVLALVGRLAWRRAERRVVVQGG
jgi:viologen exporter family transport system permease protein